MFLHLAVGDTWNNINNVEKKLGTAVLGVGAVVLSAGTVADSVVETGVDSSPPGVQPLHPDF